MRIQKFSRKATPKLISSFIACYQEVFAAPPWNKDWWTEEKVMEVIERYDTDRSAIYVTLDKSNQVIGFNVGTVYQVAELEEDIGLTLSGLSGEVLYLKDQGVLPRYQQQGLAKAMFHCRLTALSRIAKDPRFVAVRTMGPPTPTVVYDWYQRKYDFQIIAEYPEDDNRVILARPYEGFADLG